MELRKGKNRRMNGNMNKSVEKKTNKQTKEQYEGTVGRRKEGIINLRLI